MAIHYSYLDTPCKPKGVNEIDPKSFLVNGRSRIPARALSSNDPHCVSEREVNLGWATIFQEVMKWKFTFEK